MNDPAATRQLSKGFFELTANSWRWTARHFSAVLAVPPGSSSHGAVASLSLNVPAVLIQTVGPVTVSASVGSTPIGSQTYAAAGDYTFSKDVAGSLLPGNSVTLDFTLDKGMPPKPPETRELGVIVTAVGLESK